MTYILFILFRFIVDYFKNKLVPRGAGKNMALQTPFLICLGCAMFLTGNCFCYINHKVAADRDCKICTCTARIFAKASLFRAFYCKNGTCKKCSTKCSYKRGSCRRKVGHKRCQKKWEKCKFQAEREEEFLLHQQFWQKQSNPKPFQYCVPYMGQRKDRADKDTTFENPLDIQSARSKIIPFLKDHFSHRIESCHLATKKKNVIKAGLVELVNDCKYNRMRERGQETTQKAQKMVCFF